MNYVVINRRWLDKVDDFIVISAPHTTLAEAREARAVSGDLVVHNCSLRVVDSIDWLWEWEKAQSKCYARKAIRHDNPEGTRTDWLLDEKLNPEST